MTDAEAWGSKTHDDLARSVLASAIERRHFSGAPLTQFAVDVLRHALRAIEDRAAEERVKDLENALDRDRTGLAHALARVREVARCYAWIQAGEWGCYDYTKHTCETLRNEIGNCLDEITKTAEKALHDSGTLATRAIRGEPCPHGFPPGECAACDGGSSAEMPLALGCEHGRLPGHPCPHCMGINEPPAPPAERFWRVENDGAGKLRAYIVVRRGALLPTVGCLSKQGHDNYAEAAEDGRKSGLTEWKRGQ